jgi:hypothetical protein
MGLGVKRLAVSVLGKSEAVTTKAPSIHEGPRVSPPLEDAGNWAVEGSGLLRRARKMEP